MRRTTLLQSLLGGVALATLAACGGAAEGAKANTDPQPQLITDGVLKVCTAAPYEPFEFEKGGKIVGFDVDLAQEVATALDAELEVVNEDFDDIQSGKTLNEDVCDMAAAALTINGDRSRVVDFSTPYFDAAQVLVTTKTSGITSLADVAKGRLAVQTGSTGELYATDHAAETTQIVRFDNFADVDSALSGATVDAGIYDNNIVGRAIKKHPQFTVVEEFATGEQYGIAVKRDANYELLRVIDSTLAEIRESGRYDEIYESWFGKK